MPHLRMHEAADFLAVSTDTIRRMVDAGTLAAGEGDGGRRTVDAVSVAHHAREHLRALPDPVGAHEAELVQRLGDDLGAALLELVRGIGHAHHVDGGQLPRAHPRGENGGGQADDPGAARTSASVHDRERNRGRRQF